MGMRFILCWNSLELCYVADPSIIGCLFYAKGAWSERLLQPGWSLCLDRMTSGEEIYIYTVKCQMVTPPGHYLDIFNCSS